MQKILTITLRPRLSFSLLLLTCVIFKLDLSWLIKIIPFSRGWLLVHRTCPSIEALAGICLLPSTNTSDCKWVRGQRPKNTLMSTLKPANYYTKTKIFQFFVVLKTYASPGLWAPQALLADVLKDMMSSPTSITSSEATYSVDKPSAHGERKNINSLSS